MFNQSISIDWSELDSFDVIQINEPNDMLSMFDIFELFSFGSVVVVLLFLQLKTSMPPNYDNFWNICWNELKHTIKIIGYSEYHNKSICYQLFPTIKHKIFNVRSVYWIYFAACRTISQQLIFSRLLLFARLRQKAINLKSPSIAFNGNCFLPHCTYYFSIFFIHCHLRWSD